MKLAFEISWHSISSILHVEFRRDSHFAINLIIQESVSHRRSIEEQRKGEKGIRHRAALLTLC
jgi:hypothetical protein